MGLWRGGTLLPMVSRSDVKRDMLRPDGVASYQDMGAYTTRRMVSACIVREARAARKTQSTLDNTKQNKWVKAKPA